jgi:penicillin amidase
MATTVDEATREAREASLRERVPPSSAALTAAVGTVVEILRDRAGVPHVYAASTADLYFGLGFAMAQDRLWQIDRLRRRALGRQAEILGPAFVESDLLHRAVGIPEVSEREVECVDEQSRIILDSFVAGINRHIEACDGRLPIEFELLDYGPEPFSARDVLAILRGELWSLNGRLYTLSMAEAARLLPERLRSAYLTPEASEFSILPPGSPYPDAPNLVPEPVGSGLLGMGDGNGSNNWAVAGNRTATGHALLCSDPHQPFWVPSSWYEYAVHGPEDDAAGAGHPGVPGLWWGSNGAIAWGITNNAASTRDLYREEVHPTDPHLYRDGETWRRFDEYDVEVQVRGQASVHHAQRRTVHGPVVNHVVAMLDDADTAPLSLRWVGHEHLDDVRAAVAVGRARNWDQFHAALRDWALPVFNFGFAGADGRVGYQCAGRVPLRGRAGRGYRDANDPDDAWQGYIPYEGMPSVVDPPRGYIASANERVAADDYPYPLYGAFGSGYRAQRIHQAFESGATVDKAYVVDLQNDVQSCRAQRLCPPLVRQLAASGNPDVALLRDTLETWDFRYTTDSPAPTIFETFMEVWHERVMSEHFPSRLLGVVRTQTGPAARLIEQSTADGDLDWFAAGTNVQDELISAARRAVQRLTERYGSEPDDWRWGEVHRAHWRHPLSTEQRTWMDIGPESVDGGIDTVRSTGAGQPAFAAGSGTEYRLVVDFARPNAFQAVQNIGNSGQPGSPHYADQFADWRAGRYHEVSLLRADVEKNLEGTTVLQP